MAPRQAPAKCSTVYPKIFEVEHFRGFRGSENGHEIFLPRNFKFITDARWGWKLDHEILSMKICFWAEFGKTAKYFILENFRLYGMIVWHPDYTLVCNSVMEGERSTIQSSATPCLQSNRVHQYCTIVSQKRPTMDCLPTPQFCLLRSRKSAHLAQALQIGIFH